MRDRFRCLPSCGRKFSEIAETCDMNGHAGKDLVPCADDCRGGVPPASRSAMTRWGPRSAAMCLASLLLLMSQTATAEEDYYWEVIGRCRTESGTKSYLRRYPNGKYATKAHDCLKRWEAEEQSAWDRVKACDDVEAVRRFVQEHPESPHVAEASACIEIHARKAQVERMLHECRAHFRAGRISTGRVGNALECYGRVLDEDPGNPDALEGIDEIVAHYSNKAVAALDRGDPIDAEREIERVEEIVPESPDVEALRRRLEELNRDIAVQAEIEREREKLREAAEDLFEQGEHEEVIALVENAGKRGVDDKRASALARQSEDALAAEEAIRSLEAKVGEVRERIEQGDTAGARTSLEEANALGLDPETHRMLAAEIDAAEREKDEAARRQAREAMVSESRALRETGDFDGAREALRRALDSGLPEARYRAEMEGTDRLEAAEMLATTCLEHKSRRRWQRALDCVRRVLELDGGSAEAREEERQLDMLVAFSTVHQSPSVEGYFQFIQNYPWSAFVDAANDGLRELEDSYWEEVRAEGTPERYRRYLDIYPAGKYRNEARRLAAGG